MKTILSKYMNLNRIEFIVTWQCGGKCKHCQIGDSINKPGPYRHILSEYAVKGIQKLNEFFEIESVMTFGGEPLYYPNITAEIHGAAAQCAINTRQILTSGYFTNNPKESADAANSLAEAGINSLLLSVDAFHQEHLPIEPVLQFARNIVNAKIPNAFLYPAWLVNEEHQNIYNTKTNEILEKFSDIPIPVKRGNNIFPGGNAARFLREYYEKPELGLIDDCAFASCPEPLTDVKTISIVPNGDLMVCGFIIGNIYKENIIDIITRYNPFEDEYMLAVINGGVAGFFEYVKSKGANIDASQYFNACELCHALNKHVKNLAP